MAVAIIPARGGSKRIPRKNIRSFQGKPLISYSIEAAKKSGVFSRIIVSTDDHEIAEVSRFYGAETPFIRPAELADDYAGTAEVMCHALQWLKDRGEMPDFNCCIYATAPFLTAEDLRKAYQKLAESDASYCFSMTSYPFPIQRALRVGADQRIGMFQPEHRLTRSQDLEEAYHDAGQFYWSRGDAWLKSVVAYSESSIPWFLPRHRVQDIDTEEERSVCLKCLNDRERHSEDCFSCRCIYCHGLGACHALPYPC